MEHARFRLTVVRVMALVACAGVSLAAFRVHFSLGSFVTCVFLLAPYRTFTISDRCRAGGIPLSPSRMIMIFAGSLAKATILVTSSAFFALSTYAVLLLILIPSMPSHTPFPLWSPGHVFAVFMLCFIGRESVVRLLPHLWPSRWADDERNANASRDHVPS